VKTLISGKRCKELAWRLRIIAPQSKQSARSAWIVLVDRSKK